MSCKFYPALLMAVLLMGIHPVFAQTDEEAVLTIDANSVSDDEFTRALEEASDVELVNKNTLEQSNSETAPAAAGKTPANKEIIVGKGEMPEDIINNEYFMESQRLAKLAEEMHIHGDYDASANFAEESMQYALRSDVHIAIAIAKINLDKAVSSGASTKYPAGYNEAKTWYNESLSAKDAKEWNTALDAANKVTEALNYASSSGGTFPLPAKYTIRNWNISKDCFWNIAGRPWVYGNPRMWRVLYEANKSKLPNPNNPNWIEPGLVLDIPSIKGETRQGEWNSNRTYKPMP